MMYFVIFVFGLIVGSFLNCVIYRFEKKESFIKDRSFCPFCRHKLSWYDLIPILSFLFLLGKCRYCSKRISLQYPLVELATGILFILIFWDLGFDWSLSINPPGSPPADVQGIWGFLNLCFLLIVASFLIVIFVYDLKHYIIPDKVIYPLIAITFLYQILFVYWNLEFGFWGFIMSAFGASLFFLLIVLMTRGKGMGIGDIKLAFFMGLFLGFPNILVALFFSFMIGAIIGVGLILARKKKLKSEVPFGPFLIIGTFIAFFWGQALVNWYLSIL